MKMSDRIVWTESEWADDGFGAYLKGYSADVYPASDGWFWQVEASEAVSEFPELQDAGKTKTVTQAKYKAQAALRRAAKRAPDRNPNSGELNEWAKDGA